jgi:hypothetical protein
MLVLFARTCLSLSLFCFSFFSHRFDSRCSCLDVNLRLNRCSEHTRRSEKNIFLI